MKSYLGSLVIILIATTISVSGKCPSKHQERNIRPPHIPQKKMEECRSKGEVAEWGRGEDCDKTCDSPPRRMCHPTQNLRCYCPKGKVRINNGGRCISPSECPAKNGKKVLGNASNRDISPALIEKCRKKGEVARWGGDEGCDETCENTPPRMCHPIAILGCFCPKGQIRIKYGGRCIPPSECQTRNGRKFLGNASSRDIPQEKMEECRSKGEVADRGLGEDCDETCESPPGRMCHPTENLRCYCPKGQVRIRNKGRCIPRSECPARNGKKSLGNASNRDIPQKLKEECRNKGEEARSGLGEDCDETCESNPDGCYHIQELRCFCPEGKVRINFGGRCISRSECPARNGKKFLRKASNRDISPALIEKCMKKGEVARWGGDERCDETCENSPPRMCHPIAILGCFCPKGQIRIKYGGRCIPPSECPARNGQKFLRKSSSRDIPQKKIEECRSKGEVASLGPGADCDETCEGHPDRCRLIQELRCFCPKGKVRINFGGRCISPSECPTRNGKKFLGNASKSEIPEKLKEECRKNGEVARLGRGEDCDETCEGQRERCYLILKLRCFCPEGKVRINFGGRCIPRSECPARNGKKILRNSSNREIDTDLAYSCLEAGEVVEWGKPRHCDETCEGKPRVCHDEKEYKCACPEGKVRRKLGGSCIARKWCPERNAQYISQ